MSDQTDSSVAQDDLGAILRALGLGDHARPASPHHVVWDEVLPAIQALQDMVRAPGVTYPGFRGTPRRYQEET